MIIKIILNDNSILLYSDVKKFNITDFGVYIDDQVVALIKEIKDIYVMNEDGKTIDKIRGGKNV